MFGVQNAIGRSEIRNFAVTTADGASRSLHISDVFSYGFMFDSFLSPWLHSRSECLSVWKGQLGEGFCPRLLSADSLLSADTDLGLLVFGSRGVSTGCYCGSHASTPVVRVRVQWKNVPMDESSINAI